ncbi:hypothetical protein L1267_12175 [Pseudoalteromonas sp. OFAV1]|uniref:hypothetical protein n=1 Tax=Pseudoalteromonas sp. OFAV1 TaxID=2908892 RepID=UPI001F3F210B|nr:hypothetical protein [Pseudoalteromonas sp. OFAV1]MCF2901148.1 hypothetical protein [Pseudoalteromonas sp. OFAV1]
MKNLSAELKQSLQSKHNITSPIFVSSTADKVIYIEDTNNDICSVDIGYFNSNNKTTISPIADKAQAILEKLLETEKMLSDDFIDELSITLIDLYTYQLFYSGGLGTRTVTFEDLDELDSLLKITLQF